MELGVTWRRHQKQRNQERHHLIKKLIALAYLKTEDIRTDFDIIDIERLEKFPIDYNMEQLFLYFERNWLHNPELFCAYGRNNRTNNVAESHNLQLTHLWGLIHLYNISYVSIVFFYYKLFSYH